MNELLVVTPNGYKTSKLYSVVPANGTGDLTWVRNTTATRVNSSGLIESVGANVPRLDYTGGVTCPAILVEPLRTNSLTYSEDFNDASWLKSNSSILNDNTTSPNGLVTAEKIVENTSNAIHATNKTVSYTANNTISVSFFLKYSGRNAVIQISDNATGSIRGFFDIQNGTVTNTTSGGSWTGALVTIEPYLDGWFRCCITGTKGAGTSVLCRVTLFNGVSETYLGDGTSGLYVWGAQFETGSTCTSYIPTVASTQTRNADVATVTTPVGITSLIETYEDNTTNVVNPIPVTYQMSEGRIAKVVGL